MHRQRLVATAMLTLLAACTDSPMQPGNRSRAAGLVPRVSTSLTPTPTPACTHHWAAAANGSWDDATKWNPASVPGTTSVACIDASGTYAVTLNRNAGDPTVVIGAVAVGGGSGVATLQVNTANVSVTGGVNVGANGAIDFNSFSGFTIAVGVVFTNDGQVTSGASFGEDHVAVDADFLNRGTFSNTHNGSVSFTNHTVVNQGTMNFSNRVTNISGNNAVFEQQSGLLTGTGLASFTASSGTVRYLGGQVDPAAAQVQSTFGGAAVFRLTGANLELLTTTAPQAVYFDWNPPSGPFPTLTGDIGANVHLRLLDNLGPAVGLTLKGTLTNFGLFESNSVNQPTLDPEVLFVNRGTLSMFSNLHLNAPFENRGSMTFAGQGGLYLSDPTGMYDNFGTIAMTASQVFLTGGATLRIRPASSLTSTGAILIDNALLTGSGSVGMPVALTNGGTIDPGLPVGTLGVGTISSPDNSGKLRFDITGGVPATQYDQLTSTGFLTEGLNLVITTALNAQACGVVANIITFTTAGAFGAWASTTGLQPSPTVTWTPRSTPTVYTLYGSNPSTPVGIAPLGVNVAEGGATAQYAVCLSRAPASNVTVAPNPDAQVTVAPGSLLFTPANWAVPQLATVTAVDDNVAQGTHTGTITHAATSADPAFTGLALPNVTATIADNDVGGGNRQPVAQNDAVTTAEDTPVQIDVRANDSDPDGDPLTITAVSAPAHGTAQIVSGKVQYTPVANYNGGDAFTYTIGDGKGGVATGTVTVSITPVNDNPVAVNDQRNDPENALIRISVMANDSDPDGDPISISAVTQPSRGTTQILGTDVGYTPALNYVGPDAFTYTISDGRGGTATASVSVTVTALTPVNRAPVAVNDVATTTVNQAVTVNVLSNDSDPDGDPLTILAASTPPSGTTAVTANKQSIIFTPAPGFKGSVQFAYTMSDGRGATSTAIVTVTVTTPGPGPSKTDLRIATATFNKTLFGFPSQVSWDTYVRIENEGPDDLPTNPQAVFTFTYPRSVTVVGMQPGCVDDRNGTMTCQITQLTNCGPAARPDPRDPFPPCELHGRPDQAAVVHFTLVTAYRVSATITFSIYSPFASNPAPSTSVSQLTNP